MWKALFRKAPRGRRKNGGVPFQAIFRLVMKGAPAVSIVWLLFSGLYFLIDETRHSGFFQIQEVRASGLKHFGEEEMFRRVGPSLGENLVSLDLGSIGEGILQDPWVKTVSFHKAFPDRLLVRVEERLPAAVVSDPEETVVVDAEGNILEAWSRGEDVPGGWQDLPVVMGIRVSLLRNSEEGALLRFRSAYSVLREAPFFGEARLTLAVDPAGEVRVQRKDYWLRFGKGGVKEKWLRFARIEPRLEELKRPIREVDLRFQGKVIVR